MFNGVYQPALIDTFPELSGSVLLLSYFYDHIALLHLGYGFGEVHMVRVAKKVRDTELGWCLGTTLAVVGGELWCKV